MIQSNVGCKYSATCLSVCPSACTVFLHCLLALFVCTVLCIVQVQKSNWTSPNRRHYLGGIPDDVVCVAKKRLQIFEDHNFSANLSSGE